MSLEKKHFITLTCEALARSVYAVAATSPHTITVRLFRQGLHNTPKRLKEMLQDEINLVQQNEYDAILLAYGLCGMATIGLISTRLPIVIPRAHDCITLYLGSRKRYQEEFTAHPGTYWYSCDYLERNEEDNSVALGATSQETIDNVYNEYVQKYGEENANYLMEVMGAWKEHYTRAVFIDMGSENEQPYEQRARDEALSRGWSFERIQGDRCLLNKLMRGEWQEEDFLVVPPGYIIAQSMDPDVIIEAVLIEDLD